MKKKLQQLREYEFTLVVEGLNCDDEVHANALFEAGCDDASPGTCAGRGYITFHREAESLKDAILSACRDVRAADIGVEILRVDEEPLVTQADIARRAGMSRARINQYISGVRGPGGFPAPVGSLDEAATWHWSDVATWLAAQGLLDADAVREAKQVALINSVLELRQQKKAEPKLAKEVIKVLG